MSYVYQLTIRPFSFGTQPDGCKGHFDDGSRYGAIVYDHPLCEADVKTFSLAPITEAMALVGRTFEVPFGPDVDTFYVDSVSGNGLIQYHINEERPLLATYYEFLHLIEQ